MRFDRARSGTAFFDHMTDNTKERGEKRGVLSTGRAKQLDKTKDADADAADDDDEDEE